MGPGKMDAASGGQNGLQRCGLRKQLLHRLGRDATLGQDRELLLSWGAAWARRREKEARAAYLYTIGTKQMVTPFFQFLSIGESLIVKYAQPCVSVCQYFDSYPLSLMMCLS